MFMQLKFEYYYRLIWVWTLQKAKHTQDAHLGEEATYPENAGAASHEGAKTGQTKLTLSDSSLKAELSLTVF